MKKRNLIILVSLFVFFSLVLNVFYLGKINTFWIGTSWEYCPLSFSTQSIRNKTRQVVLFKPFSICTNKKGLTSEEISAEILQVVKNDNVFESADSLEVVIFENESLGKVFNFSLKK